MILLNKAKVFGDDLFECYCNAGSVNFESDSSRYDVYGVGPAQGNIYRCEVLRELTQSSTVTIHTSYGSNPGENVLPYVFYFLNFYNPIWDSSKDVTSLGTFQVKGDDPRLGNPLIEIKFDAYNDKMKYSGLSPLLMIRTISSNASSNSKVFLETKIVDWFPMDFYEMYRETI